MAMGNSARGVRAGLVWLGLAGICPALQPPAPPAQRNWDIREFTYIKRVAREAGAGANEHPVKLSAADLARRLSPITLDNDEPLFGKAELAELAGPLSAALAAAGPGDDLVLLSTSQRGGPLLSSRLALTARVFVQGGELNLIVHDARLDFYDRYIGTHTLPAFTFGSRAQPGPVRMQCPGAVPVRPDWLALPPVEAAPAAAAAAAAPVTAPAAAPKARDEAFYAIQQQRLRGLKGMRDQDLITQEEYQKKRQEIIDGL